MDALAQLLKGMERVADQGYEPYSWLNDKVGESSSSCLAQNPVSKDEALRSTSLMLQLRPYL